MADDEKCIEVGKFVWKYHESVGWYDADEDDPAMDTEIALLDEIERLRQGIWDACIALGMDTDGNDTPRHLVYPPLADLIVREAQRARQDYDELLDELSEARREQ